MRVLLFMILTFTCGSCAFFRYHSTVINKPDRKIRNVAVLLVMGEYQNEFITNRLRLGATTVVAEELADLHAFNFKILERNIPLFKITNMQDNDLAYELRQHYDAYIVISTSAKNSVTLEMRETNSGSTPLIETRAAAPGMEEAVRETMELFAKEWKTIE